MTKRNDVIGELLEQTPFFLSRELLQRSFHPKINNMYFSYVLADHVLKLTFQRAPCPSW